MHAFVCSMISYRLYNAATNVVSNDCIYIVDILTPTASAYNIFANSDLKLPNPSKCACLLE